MGFSFLKQLKNVGKIYFSHMKKTVGTYLWVNYLPQWCVEFDDELSWLFTKRFRVFTLFAENIQILLKISVIPILLTFMYLVALNLLVSNQLNSSLRHIIVTMHCFAWFDVQLLTNLSVILLSPLFTELENCAI